MKNHFFKTLLVLIAITTFISCEDSSSDEVYIPKGEYDLGFIVSNEGNFGSPNASVSFISEDLLTSVDQVFSKVNSNTPLGDVLQSITFDDNYAYLVVNNSNKIEVVDRYTFKQITTLTENISLPKYAEVEDGKLYITNSGSKSIVVYNVSDFSYNSTIEIKSTVDQIIIEDDFIYVQNAAFGFGNKITVVDIKTNTIIKTIETGEGLNSMEEEDGILYAMHKTGVTKINTTTNEVIGEITLAGELASTSQIDIEDGIIYFISGTKIYAAAKSSTEFADIPLVDTKVEGPSWFVGYGFAVENDKIFYSDVKGFTENSALLVYNLKGEFLESINTGIGTNNVYFND
jgi:hypothetical protein